MTHVRGAEAMLGVDKEFFLQISGESDRRILHPAKVVGVSDGLYTAEFEETDIEVEAEQEILVFYNQKRDFVKQAARVTDAPQEESALQEESPETPGTFTFETLGDVVSAENRECYRVSTVMSELTAIFGEERDCAILDISNTGFAVSSNKLHEVASIVEVILNHDGVEYTGTVCIQSVRELHRGKIRYGVSCIADKSIPNDLLEGVRRMSITTQRDQLRRLSAAC